MLGVSLLIAFFVLSLGYVYPIDPDILEAVLDTTPSAVLYYAEGEQLSEFIRANFIEASERLQQYGILFGTYNCAPMPEKCKTEQIRNIPDIRLNLFSLFVFSFFPDLLFNSYCYSMFLYRSCDTIHLGKVDTYQCPPVEEQVISLAGYLIRCDIKSACLPNAKQHSKPFLDLSMQ